MNPFAESLTEYTPYIEAVASPRSKLHLHLRKSPRAILERLMGLNTAIDAPDWTSWECKIGTIMSHIDPWVINE